MLPQQFSFEIFQKKKNKELLVKLIKQLNKDFNQTGIEYYFDENISPKELANGLQKQLEYLLNNDFQTYVNLLYRIDISEAKLKKMEDIEIKNISKKVTILILKREWQKIWFKSRTQ